MSALASQFTSVSIACSIVCSDADQSKYQRSASLTFVRGIYRWQVNSPHKGSLTRKKTGTTCTITGDAHCSCTLLVWFWQQEFLFHKIACIGHQKPCMCPPYQETLCYGSIRIHKYILSETFSKVILFISIYAYTYIDGNNVVGICCLWNLNISFIHLYDMDQFYSANIQNKRKHMFLHISWYAQNSLS